MCPMHSATCCLRVGVPSLTGSEIRSGRSANLKSSMTNRNRWTLQQFLEEGYDSLFTDQLAELYNNILLKVQKAAALKWKQGPEKKKLVRVAFRAWLHETVQRIKGHGPSQGGKNLRRK